MRLAAFGIHPTPASLHPSLPEPAVSPEMDVLSLENMREGKIKKTLVFESGQTCRRTRSSGENMSSSFAFHRFESTREILAVANAYLMVEIIEINSNAQHTFELFTKTSSLGRIRNFSFHTNPKVNAISGYFSSKKRNETIFVNIME